MSCLLPDKQRTHNRAMNDYRLWSDSLPYSIYPPPVPFSTLTYLNKKTYIQNKQNSYPSKVGKTHCFYNDIK